MEILKLLAGRKFTIFYIRGSKADVPEILDGLGDGDKDKPKAYERIDRCAEHGPPRNIEQCRKIESVKGLWELKAGRIRIPFFYRSERGQVLLTHVFMKTKNDQSEYLYAATVRNKAEGVN